MVNGSDLPPCCGDLLDGVVGIRRDTHVHAQFGTCPACCELCVWMSHALKPRWGYAEWECDVPVEQTDLGADLRDIFQDSGEKAIFLVCGRVLTDSHLVGCSGVEEIWEYSCPSSVGKGTGGESFGYLEWKLGVSSKLRSPGLGWIGFYRSSFRRDSCESKRRLYVSRKNCGMHLEPQTVDWGSLHWGHVLGAGESLQ